MISIAIDGPAGAGKSTIAQEIARRIEATYVDTGAMYRALTYKALMNQISVDDEDSLVTLLQNSQIDLSTGDPQEVFLDQENVTAAIRDPQISELVSKVAQHQKVREILVEKQREFAQLGSVVMDGRDIGTKVLPNAQLKIFLTASVEERAKRRYLELLNKGFNPDLKQLAADIEARDYRDSHRAASPLKKASDAVEIDTTSMSIPQVVDKIYQLYQQIK